MSTTGWIGVDLDGTLAHYEGWKGAAHIGNPVPMILQRVSVWLAEGRDVRIFTARVSHDGTKAREAEAACAREAIKAWCVHHFGVELPITNVKDYAMVELWDDRAIQVQPNTGMPVQAALVHAEAQREKLAAFKAFVHEFLDRNGVPTDPPGKMREEGCRVGQRLKYLADERDSAREAADAATQGVYSATMLEAAKVSGTAMALRLQLTTAEADLREARARVAKLEAGLRTSLESVQNTLEAAYHNCYESCCGRAGYECCGNTVQTWTAEDQRTMDVLGPVERSLRALLSPSPEPKP